MPITKRCVAALAAFCLLGTGTLTPARAALVATPEVLHPQASPARAHVNAWLARDAVRQVLVDNGVALADVQARVDAMSDAEVGDFAARIDSSPAGGDLLGILFGVFVLLLITDILGLTKVFPFTRPIR